MRHILGVTDEERQQRRCAHVPAAMPAGRPAPPACPRPCLACPHARLPCQPAQQACHIQPAPAYARRDEVLGTSLADFHAFADALEAVQARGSVAAVCSPERYEAAQAERPGFFQHVKKLL